jgi:hypothetical protein
MHHSYMVMPTRTMLPRQTLVHRVDPRQTVEFWQEYARVKEQVSATEHAAL